MSYVWLEMKGFAFFPSTRRRVKETSKGGCAAIANLWTSDATIIAEIGDFTSTCCMAAQPIYNRAGMIQLSPTASHTKFASGSKWSFSAYGTQYWEQPVMAALAVDKLGLKNVAVLFITFTADGDAIKTYKPVQVVNGEFQLVK